MTSPLCRPHRAGFTLIELSIVLVIIGLMAGGLFVGRSMLESSKLQSVVSDLTKYRVAVADFKRQYGGIPGDLADAQDYWGVSTACAGTATDGACNGDGDGKITDGTAANSSAEPYQFWRQLVLSGRIIGTFSGVAGPGGGTNTVGGTNAPATSLPTGAWEVGTWNNYAGSPYFYAYEYGNYFRIGSMSTAAASLPLMKPEDAAAIDGKIDDGMPGTGTAIAGYWNNACVVYNPAANAANNNYTGTYNSTKTDLQCILFFTNQF